MHGQLFDCRMIQNLTVFIGHTYIRVVYYVDSIMKRPTPITFLFTVSNRYALKLGAEFKVRDTMF